SNACGVLRSVHDASGGMDGFVSLEVSPAAAYESRTTIDAARGLHQRIGLPNLMVKIPATEAGVPAIRQMIGEGRNINVTLIFSLERYGEVIEAYLGGLEDLGASGGDLGAVHSVASFFVSRVDTEVDRRLEDANQSSASQSSPSQAPAGLAGKAAVAQARLAYKLFQERFTGPRWDALSARGAHVQRPLWASTSTKNPAYPDLLYVESLIGPDTVDTMPDATVEAFEDHGRIARTVDQKVDGAKAHLEALAGVGIDMADVAQSLEDEGVASFAKSFDHLLSALEEKAAGTHSR
ncbi:MAG: transaldolase, partial [Acidimicrobiales bacterium]